jgi:hypothetical protein
VVGGSAETKLMGWGKGLNDIVVAVAVAAAVVNGGGSSGGWVLYLLLTNSSRLACSASICLIWARPASIRSMKSRRLSFTSARDRTRLSVAGG